MTPTYLTPATEELRTRRAGESHQRSSVAESPAPIELDGEPWRLVQEWLPPNGDADRPQMTLSTVDALGRPDARTVLLTEFDRSGFCFHTDSRSRKVEQLMANPGVALTFLWPGFTRQLVVQGVAEVAPPAEIAAAYRGRSLHLRQLAWLNTAEFAQLPTPERLERWQAFTREHPEGRGQPETWTGFLVRPDRLTFWRGSAETASQRTEYTTTPTNWIRTLLPG